MDFSQHKTKIVCTIGPACEQVDTLQAMILAGMNVARLNFSHGDIGVHQRAVENIRLAESKLGRKVAIMADLPGPKIRIGKIENEPVDLSYGQTLVLTSDEVIGTSERVSVSLPQLTEVVKPGDRLFINDGLINLEVTQVMGKDAQCKVLVGGELRSRKGLNFPGIDLGMSAFTEHDAQCLKAALELGVDAISQSFVASADDVLAVRKEAQRLGHDPFIISKIERAEALKCLDDILAVSDGVMVARGDLGVEMPIEEIAIVQKQLTEKANLLGKPVITATHMLDSMMYQTRPTRAEATDVANAILDGTDCVMLSGESAMGKYPVEAVTMLASIAQATEPHRHTGRLTTALSAYRHDDEVNMIDLIALSVQRTLECVKPVAVVCPTRSGATARNVARFRPTVPITAFTPNAATYQALQFSYGVQPIQVDKEHGDWSTFTRDWLKRQGFKQGLAILTQGPAPENPTGNHRMEILELNPVGFSPP